MRTRLGFLRHQFALLSLAVSVLALAVWGLAPRPAHAESNATMPDRAYSAGPIQLQNGERVLIGLLLPAVQKAREAGELQPPRRQWHAALDYIPRPARHESERIVLLLVLRHHLPGGGPNSPNGGVFEIHAKGVPVGGSIGPVVTVPSADGTRSGCCYRPFSKTARPPRPWRPRCSRSTSNGGTMTHALRRVLDVSRSASQN